MESPDFKFSSIKFDPVGIAKVLEQERLSVPPNQREYSWEEKQATELFLDLNDAISKNKDAYFLGTIVLTPASKGGFMVVDGQQRLATTTILLAAIRDIFINKSKKPLADSIQSDFLFKLDRKTQEPLPKLSLNLDDNEFFRKRILSEPASKDRDIAETKKSHQRMVRCYAKAREYLSKVLAPYNESQQIELLNKWADFLRDSALVIALKVPDFGNAFMMFETLNDRGLKMSQADLVKNHLYSEAGKRLSEAQQSWAKTMGALEVIEQPEITINFLRHICSALYGLTREREVFEKIKRNVSGEFNAIAFLTNLAVYSADYVAMLNENNHKWNSYPFGARVAIKTLNQLNVLSIRPLMFAVAHKFSPKEAEKAFEMFIGWTVRFFVCGGSTSGAVEEAYADAAKNLMTGEIKNCTQLLAAMVDKIANDTEFQETFKTMRVSREYLARYYLRSLEMVARNQPNPSWVPNEDTDAVNLEHVLPKKYEAHWSELDEETANAYLKRLGNLALLEAKDNVDIDNLPFKKKKATYLKSKFKLTEMIGQNQDWDIEAINDRQSKLAQFALKAWPIGVK